MSTSPSAVDNLQASVDRLKAVTAAGPVPAPTTPQVYPPHTLIGGPENLKLLFDFTMLRGLAQLPMPSPWETMAQIAMTDCVDLKRRVSNNAAAFDHIVNMNAATAGQIGDTEGQSQVTPIRTGAADSQNQQPAGAVYPPIRNVDQTGAAAAGATNAAIAQIAAQVGALADTVTALVAAINPILTKASGDGSSPAPAAAA